MKDFVQWHEGMLMSPQHFQQSINHIQSIVSDISSSVFPFGYGLFELKIDTSSLPVQSHIVGIRFDSKQFRFRFPLLNDKFPGSQTV